MSKDAQNADIAHARRRKARAEAAAWIARLHGPDRSPGLEAGWRTWLSESVENAAEFERVTDIWDAAATRPAAGIPRMSRATSMAARDSQQRRHHGLVAAMVTVIIGIAATLAIRSWWYPSFTTEVGEQRIVHLDDGTRVTLNTGTKITLAFTGAQRRVRLDLGEAFFEVAHNPERPFVVAVGSRQVTALGTSFAVSYEPNRTAVTLVEGKVSVTSVGGTPVLPTPQASTLPPNSGDNSDTGTVFLAPGERITYSGIRAPRRDIPKLEAVTAWRRGEIVLDKTTLADAAAELNRYETTRLIVEDPGTAALRVSGIYHAGDSAGFASTVGELYGLNVRHEGAEIRLRSK